MLWLIFWDFIWVFKNWKGVKLALQLFHNLYVQTLGSRAYRFESKGFAPRNTCEVWMHHAPNCCLYKWEHEKRKHMQCLANYRTFQNDYFFSISLSSPKLSFFTGSEYFFITSIFISCSLCEFQALGSFVYIF